MPTADVRPGRLDITCRPGNGYTLTLTWPADVLDGRTFEASLDDADETPFDVSVAGDVMTIVVDADVTGAVTGRRHWRLFDTTGADPQAVIVGRLLLSLSGTESQNASVTVTSDEVAVAVSVAGMVGPTGPQGATGAQGDPGPQGPQGDPGDTGPLLADLLGFLGMSVDVVDTAPRWDGGGNLVAVGGTLYLTYFTPLVSKTVSNITMQTATTGTAPSGITLARMALFTAAANGDVTPVARTASDTSLFDTNFEAETRAFDTAGGFPASYNLVAGTRYAAGVLQVGTTPGRIATAGNVLSGVSAMGLRMAAVKTGQTDISAAITSVADNLTLGTPWARLS